VHDPSVFSLEYQNCDATLIRPSLLNRGSISLLPAAASTIPVLAGSLGSTVFISYENMPSMKAEASSVLFLIGSSSA
jgi:hypothetical protein